mmetsp:Transcript_36085/g.36770  ORF Transcript_36085/g.36770 Transcript_36085/m.36770 type:complete len:405 (-) Transcript_36085:43-1257(-)
MQIIFRLLAISLIVQSCSAAKKKSESSTKNKEEAGQQRFIELANTDDSVIRLSDANFTKYISERPRLYNAAIMFTALGPNYQCGICGIAAQKWIEAAKYYSNQYELATVDAPNRLIFFLVDVDDARSTFGKIGIESVPRSIALPATVTGGPKQRIGDFELRQEVIMEGVGAFLAEIKNLTGVQVAVTIDPWPVLLILSVVSILIAWFVALASKDISAALLWYRSSRIWIFVSMLCFGVGVSGSIYCVIRSAPLYGSSRTGVSIFSGQNRDQYIIEGIILALFTLSAGMALVAMNFATKIPIAIIRHVGVLISMSVFIIMLLQIWYAYTDKTRWYSLKDTLPPIVWSWMTSSVKKNSGLLKRFWRVCEFWLLEFKDWEGMQRKAKILIYDYIGRQYFGVKAVGSS